MGRHGNFRRKGCEVALSQLHKRFGGKARVTTGRGGNEEEKKKENGESEHKGHDYFITPKFGMDQHFIIVHCTEEVSAQSVGGIWITII